MDQQQAAVSVAAIESNRERLVNLIDLHALKPELQGRAVLSPYLETVKTTTSSNTEREEVQRLLDFVTNSGHLQAVNALTGALQAEKTHPGHEEAFKLLLESSVALASSAAISEDVFAALRECIPSIEENLDFSALSPTLLQRGIISQDLFMSWQGTYISPSEKAENLIKSVTSQGMKGVVDFIMSLQAVRNDRHQSVATDITEKIQRVAGSNPDALPKDHAEMLTKAGILAPPSAVVSPSSLQGNTAVDKKDRVAVIISMETYYARSDVNSKLSVRDRNGRLLTEKRKELEGLFEELGCSVVNVTDAIVGREDASSSEVVQECFSAKVNDLCNKNTQVLVCILGLVYHLKGEGMALLLRDKVDFPDLSQCLTEKQLAKGLLSLPTPYVTVMVDCYWLQQQQEKDFKQLSSANPWQSLCPWDSRGVVYYTALAPNVTSQKIEYEADKQNFGLLSDCLIRTMKRWYNRGQSNQVTHLNIFNIICMLWDPASHAAPCVKGDVDRMLLGCNDVPMPYCFVGCCNVTTTSGGACSSVSLQCGSSVGFVSGETVKLFHAFVPEKVFTGVVSDGASKCSCVVSVTDKEEWAGVLSDVQKNDLDGKEEELLSFVSVYKQLDGEEGCSVELDVSDPAIEEELLSFLDKFNAIFGRRDGGIVVKYSSGGQQLEVTSQNVKSVRRVSSVQLAKSMIARIAINECVRKIRSSFSELDPIMMGCYLYPYQSEPLLSKEKLGENAFSIVSSACHNGCPPENALCEFDDDKFWSPSFAPAFAPPFLSVKFPQNVYLTAVEVRGISSLPKYFPSGYLVLYQARVMVCDDQQQAKRRFEGPTRNKRSVSVRLQSIDPLKQGLKLRWCEDVHNIEINPLTNGSHKRMFFSIKFYHFANNKEIPVTEYQLGGEYSDGYSFSHQLTDNRIIKLGSPDQWLTVKYPISPVYPLYLRVNYNPDVPKIRLSKLELCIPDDLLDSDEFESPKMFDLELKGPLIQLNYKGRSTSGELLPSITCSSYMPERLSLPAPILCCYIELRPTLSPMICLQCQMFGYASSSGTEVYEGDLLQVVLQYASSHVLYLVVLCIEDTGAINIIDRLRLPAGAETHVKLIRTFIPEGFKEVDDLYKVIISSFPLNLTSLEQNGCVDYHTTRQYNTNLTLLLPEQVEQVQEWWRTYNYKVRIKSRGRT